MNLVSLNVPNVRVARVKDHPLPVVIQQQESCVTFLIVLNAKFDKSLGIYLDVMNQVLNDPIFIELRKNFEPQFSETGIWWLLGYLPGHLLSKQQQGRFTIEFTLTFDACTDRLKSSL